MLTGVKAKFDLHLEQLIADTAYGTGPLLGWLVDRKIVPHVPVFDKSGRNDGTWILADFEWDAENDQYICPEGHALALPKLLRPKPEADLQRRGLLSCPERGLLGLSIQIQILPQR